jgi:hypothetical protein
MKRSTTAFRALYRIALLAFSLGCGATHAEDSPAEPALVEAPSEIAVSALTLLGVSYRYGGTNFESGFDCSGLVRHVFNDTVGMQLPRRSVEMSRLGGKVPKRDLQPGDLVFFNTLRRAFSHVGIYIGGRRFVHAPSTGGGIRVEDLDSGYWVRRFNGGRRLELEQSSAPAKEARFVGTKAPPSKSVTAVEPTEIVTRPDPFITTGLISANPL